MSDKAGWVDKTIEFAHGGSEFESQNIFFKVFSDISNNSIRKYLVYIYIKRCIKKFIE